LCVYGIDRFFVSTFYDRILTYSRDEDLSSKGSTHIKCLMERIMPEPKPSSRPSRKLPRFLVGRDSRGRWVVLDQWHLSGGLFIGRAEAIRYVMFESGRRPQAVIMVPGIVELGGKRCGA
jgi:hypothetical protein